LNTLSVVVYIVLESTGSMKL